MKEREDADGASREAEPGSWKSRALAAEQEVRDLRERLLALALILPPEHLGLLTGDSPTLDEAAGAADVFVGWDDTPFMTPSHVTVEMEGLWKRLPSRRA